jgi:hypothetical protein
MNSAGGRPAVVAACVAVSAAAAAVFTCVPPVLLVEVAAAEPFGLGHLLDSARTIKCSTAVSTGNVQQFRKQQWQQTQLLCQLESAQSAACVGLLSVSRSRRLYSVQAMLSTALISLYYTLMRLVADLSAITIASCALAVRNNQFKCATEQLRSKDCYSMLLSWCCSVLYTV